MLFCILISVSLHQTQEEGVKLCLHVLQSVFSAGGTTVKLTHLVVSQRKERHQTLIESTNLELFFAVWSTACVSFENRTIWLAHPALTHAGLLLRALFGQKPDSSCSMLCSETFVSHDFSFLCSVFCSLGSFLCFSWHPQCFCSSQYETFSQSPSMWSCMLILKEPWALTFVSQHASSYRHVICYHVSKIKVLLERLTSVWNRQCR